jgi:hypothetical protein
MQLKIKQNLINNRNKKNKGQNQKKIPRRTDMKMWRAKHIFLRGKKEDKEKDESNDMME